DPADEDQGGNRGGGRPQGHRAATRAAPTVAANPAVRVVVRYAHDEVPAVAPPVHHLLAARAAGAGGLPDRLAGAPAVPDGGNRRRGRAAVPACRVAAARPAARRPRLTAARQPPATSNPRLPAYTVRNQWPCRLRGASECSIHCRWWAWRSHSWLP